MHSSRLVARAISIPAWALKCLARCLVSPAGITARVWAWDTTPRRCGHAAAGCLRMCAITSRVGLVGVLDGRVPA
ncbi:hypothetical protein C8J57DRAFT_1323192 [Mycena rebaudengoi]|nr:hypothetical protein C8J57DRAFT_1323192 [Mycena rebaudengoi]